MYWWRYLRPFQSNYDMYVYRKDAEKLKDELSMARMKALSESQRVLELERKLYGTEQALKQRHSDNMRLQVKLEELKMKYTPNGIFFSPSLNFSFLHKPVWCVTKCNSQVPKVKIPFVFSRGELIFSNNLRDLLTLLKVFKSDLL